MTVFYGILLPFLGTVLGAGCVFFLKKSLGLQVQRALTGFAPKELQVGNGIWRVDMMKCPYHDTCVAYGYPELCRCYCDSDDISYAGLHPKLIWERSMTLGRGDDRCDFCMKIMK